MKELPLTQEKFVLVDDEDFVELSKQTWYYNSGTNHACFGLSQKILQTDRMVDHKNGNSLDYQKHNLRICTSAQNQQNCKKTKRKVSSRYRGVCLDKRRKKWIARITFQNIFGQQAKLLLGSFLVEEEAAKVFD